MEALLDKRATRIYMQKNNINSIVHIHTRWHHMGLDCFASVVSTWTELQGTGALRPGHQEDKHSGVQTTPSFIFYIVTISL